MYILGVFLRSLSILFFIVAGQRLAAGVFGYYRSNQVAIGIAVLIVGILLFLIGSWLKKPRRKEAIRDHIRRAEVAWWKADYGFRFSVFIGFIWMVGSYFLQNKNYRDLEIVILPPIALIIVFAGYKKFVVSRPYLEADGAIENFISDSSKVKEVEENNLKENKENDGFIKARGERERDMDELIRRMKNGK